MRSIRHRAFHHFSNHRKGRADWTMVLVGQPNCGKSTLFNEVAGYRSVSSNFPGATVSYTRSYVCFEGRTVELIDLPGTYSLTSVDEAEREAQRFLLTRRVDLIINVMDASLISRSLELTLQLLELEIPMVLCLNMMDEAERKGIMIDTEELSERLGIPVVQAIASRGKGVRTLFSRALDTAERKKLGHHIRGHQDVENVIDDLKQALRRHYPSSCPFSEHLMATKLLEKDPYFERLVGNERGILQEVRRCRGKLSRRHGQPPDEVIASERHDLSMSIFEQISTFQKPHVDWRNRIDTVLMHNVWGYVILILLLFLFFQGIFKMGSLIEGPLLSWMPEVQQRVRAALGEDSLVAVIAAGAVQGIGGGIAIVLPYLFPFLFILALLEDVGYLPRVAFLMDAFMHRIGLHGKAIIPVILGYGCNVPAVMATRILESRRDRMIAAVIASMVPCAARMTIILGLVGYYLGGMAALGVYIINLLVIALSGGLFSRLMPEVSAGMVLEIPAYQIPRLRSSLAKTWLRLKDFILVAWPLLIAGSAALALIDAGGLAGLVNRALSPLTALLGLPVETGIPLIFGILRKELTLLMLIQALGTGDVASVMSMAQILTFTMFVIYYIPCVATIGALIRQIQWKGMAAVTAYTFILAVIMALITRLFTAIIL